MPERPAGAPGASAGTVPAGGIGTITEDDVHRATGDRLGLDERQVAAVHFQHDEQAIEDIERLLASPRWQGHGS